MYTAGPMGMRIYRAGLLTLLILIGSSTEALAGGYVGVGMGSGSELHGDIASHFSTDDDTANSRIIIGQSFGAVSLEASLFGSQLRGASAMAGTEDYSTISLGVDVKYALGLIGSLDAYGKLGINKTWLGAPAESDLDHEGRGQEIGLGLQYTFNLPLTEVGLWADYTVQRTELRDSDHQALDGELAMLNLGVSLGF